MRALENVLSDSYRQSYCLVKNKGRRKSEKEKLLKCVCKFFYCSAVTVQKSSVRGHLYRGHPWSSVGFFQRSSVPAGMVKGTV